MGISLLEEIESNTRLPIHIGGGIQNRQIQATETILYRPNIATAQQRTHKAQRKDAPSINRHRLLKESHQHKRVERPPATGVQNR